MKRFLTVAAGALMVAAAGNAKVHFNEQFAYPEGPLYKQGEWLRNDSETSVPVTVTPASLTREGYQAATLGGAAHITQQGVGPAETLKRYFPSGVATGDVFYFSTLVKVEKVGDNAHFIGVFGYSSTYVADTKKNNAYLRLYAVKNEANPAKFHFGIAKGNINPDAVTEATYNVGETYLAVCRYEKVEGTKNDVLSLWINPTAVEAEAGIPAATTTAGSDMLGTGAAGVALFGSSSSQKMAPDVTVDAVRVADTWAELFAAEETAAPPVAEFAASFSAAQCEQTIYRCGFDSTDDIQGWTLTGATSNWMLAQTAIPKVLDFKTINPDSKKSLFCRYTTTDRNDLFTSPAVEIPAGAKVDFWSAFSPIFLIHGKMTLEVHCNGEVTTLWNSFMWAQTNGIDDTRWNHFEYPLTQFEGKTVNFAFRYKGNGGEDFLIDDFRVSCAATSDDAKVNIVPGAQVNFLDLSGKEAVKWAWQFPGADTETSTEQNPTVTYSNPGVYDVTLTAETASGKSSTLTRTAFVTVKALPPTAIIGIPNNAYFSPEASLVVPLETPVEFADLSTGNPTDRTWLFPGTDTPTSNEVNPSVKYITPGVYDVDLTVESPAGTSSTYIYMVKAGQPSRIWNIAPWENGSLASLPLGFFGHYGGTNWLGMAEFAEEMAQPMAPMSVSAVDVWFAAATLSEASKSAPITVTLRSKGTDGMPASLLATATLAASELVDASESYNAPTTFTFPTPVAINEPFFVTIGGFPNQEGDEVAMYTIRREEGGESTVYHYAHDEENPYEFTGPAHWYKNSDEAVSFAIAPHITFTNTTGPDGITATTATPSPTTPVEWYTLQGVRVAAPTAPGLYLRRQGTATTKHLTR